MRPHRSGLTVAERDACVLDALRGMGWTTPMRIGGTDASHHSSTLARLVKRGLVERRQRYRAFEYRLAEGSGS